MSRNKMFHTRASGEGPQNTKGFPLNTRAPNLPSHRFAWAPSYERPANRETSTSTSMEITEVQQPRGRARTENTRGNQQESKRSAIGVCTKYTIFVENFMLFFLGIAFTSLGSYILYVKKKTVHEAFDFFLDPSCDMCLLGCILLVMSLLGLLGSLRENTFLLKAYYYLMIMFLLLELLLCIMIFVIYYSPEVKEAIFPKDVFNKAIRNYRDDIDMQNLIDGLQTELQCCGMSDSEQGYLDWNNNAYFNCSTTNRSPESCSVPSSCCKFTPGKIINHQCGWKVLNSDKNIYMINTDGCMKALIDWVNKHALVVAGVLIGILLPQIFFIVFTANLIKMIEIQKSRWTKTT